MIIKKVLFVTTVLALVISACAPSQSAESLSPSTQSEIKNIPASTPVPISGYDEKDTYDQNNDDITTYQAGKYISTDDDNYSTFGVDVDTASYTMTRKYLHDNRLPPTDSIRTEEFINFFEMDYMNPTTSAFGLLADAAPSPFDQGKYLLRIGIKGHEVSEYDRKPLALVFVIDVSGSMSSTGKLSLVKDSLELLVNRLLPGDTVSIVVFGSETKVILPPTDVINKREILRSLYGLHSSGSTNAEAGLRAGYQISIENFDPGLNNRVILCSDGVANVGLTEANRLLDFIRGYANAGISLTTLGFGMGDFDDSFMEELADDGDGFYAYIDDEDEARRLFVDELVSTMQVIAIDAKVQVEFNQDIVQQYRLIGYENRSIEDEDFRNDSVDAGEIGSGHSVTALYELILNPYEKGRIATVNFRWEDPDNRNVQEVSGDYFTWDLIEDFDEANDNYQLAVIVAQFAEILKGEEYKDGMNIRALFPYISKLVENFPKDHDIQELEELIYKAYALLEL
ncbi:MAG: von Willebrand factor type A domain-containing protein [Anaerolineaceae bacterium]|nr:von Willebrand factor type A domain-containing protein [Anaerolineaceae bacterium]